MIRILLADDDHAVRGVVKVVLERAGYTVYAAADGNEALALLRSTSVDFALLDIEMPGMSGIDVCGLMRADPELRRIPVTMMTGRPIAGIPERVQAAGALDLIAKPFDRQDLLSRVRRHVDAARTGNAIATS